MDSKTRLLASSGKEFIKPAGIFQNSAEVRKARKEAMGRLGLDFLDVAEDDDMDIDKELAAADEPDVDSEMKPDTPLDESGTPLRPDTPIDGKAGSPTERVRSTTPGHSEDDLAGLSARERNRLKRKRKPGNSAFVHAPPPTNTGAKYNVATTGAANK